MRLQCGDDAAVIVGPQVKLKMNLFQGFVVQLSDPRKLQSLLTTIKTLPRLRKVDHLPYAVRIRGGQDVMNGPECDESMRRKWQTQQKLRRTTPDDGNNNNATTDFFQDWDDDGQPGVGDRLLHLLEKWQVESVVLLVGHQDASLSRRLIGAELFKLVIESAKLALEEYYMHHVKPTDAAKMELLEASKKTKVVITPRDDGPRVAVCMMTSETVSSWPKNHYPTPDGGGKRTVKRGRVNHFLYGTNAAENFQNPASPLHNVTKVMSPRTRVEKTNNNTEDSPPTHGGIDWLQISRDEWDQLRNFRVPVRELHYLFMCLVILLEMPVEKKPVKSRPVLIQDEEYTPPSFSWKKCREILHDTSNWSDKLRNLHGTMLTKSQVQSLRAIFQEPNFTEQWFARLSMASARIYSWLQRLLDDYDELELGLRDKASVPTPAPDLSVIGHKSPPKVPSTPPPAVPVAPSTPAPAPPASPSGKLLHPRPPPTEKETELSKELTALVHRQESRLKGPRIVDKGRMFK